MVRALMSELPEPPTPEHSPVLASEPIEDSDQLEDWELGELFDAVLPLDGDDALDSEEASELDSGFEANELDIAQAGDDAELDVGSDADDLLSVPDPDGDADDSEGTDSMLMEGLPELDNLPLGDDEEGPDTTFAELGVPGLPPLEAEKDEEDETEAENLPASWLNRDEPRPPAAHLPWPELSGGPSLEACGALATADGVVVTASSDLLWFAPGSLTPLRLEAGSSKINSLALCATGWEYAVCATASGRLLRRGRLAAASEELRGARDVSLTGPESFELCQPGPALPHTLLVRTARGLLLRSDDDGLVFRRVMTSRGIRAISPHGAPALALTFDGVLLKSDDGAGSFEEIPIPPAFQELLIGEEPLLAAHDDCVVLGEQNFGVAVSLDGGKSFERVAGTLGVSALCAAEWNGSPSVWVALYDDVDRSWIVRIDPESRRAESIACLEPTSAEEEDLLERSRVARIEWEPVQGRLWLAGSFGIKVLTPPSTG